MTDLSADVLVIGAGPCGGAATWGLSGRGLDVLCIDRGGWMDHGAIGRDRPDYERRKQDVLHANPNIRRDRSDEPVDDAGSPIKPMIAHGAAGTSPYWAAHVPRFRPADFTMFSDDGVGADWPLRYDDLAPFYDRVEAQWGTAQVTGDPTLPDRHAPVQPLPAIGAHGERVVRALEDKGWHWWPVDLAVGQDGAAPETGFCTHPGPCDIGCPSRQRSSSDRAFLAPAIARGARFEPGMRVQRLVTGPDGQVSHALCRRTGPAGEDTIRVFARRFILAGGGMGTPRLLLLSGIASSSGLVGRNLMLHPHARMDALFDDPVGAWAPQELAGIISLEFFATDRSRGFLRGLKLQLSPGPGPMAIARGGASGQRLPWGADHHAAFEARFDHGMGMTVCVDDLPEHANHIGLSTRMTDRDGLPAASWHYRLGDNTRRILDFGLERAGELLTHAGAHTLHTTPLIAQSGFHIMGTTAMRDDPARSVVDGFGRSHDVGNLFVADPSVFVTASSMNPTLTGQALALRTAEHVAQDL